MNSFTEKIRRLEREVAEERGSLNLFALLERDDLTNRWDLVVSAPWAKQDEETLRYLAASLKRLLTPEEMTRLSRLVVLDASHDPVKAITETYDVEHGEVELRDPVSFGLPVRHGYIITSRRAA